MYFHHFWFFSKGCQHVSYTDRRQYLSHSKFLFYLLRLFLYSFNFIKHFYPLILWSCFSFSFLLRKHDRQTADNTCTARCLGVTEKDNFFLVLEKVRKLYFRTQFLFSFCWTLLSTNKLFYKKLYFMLFNTVGVFWTSLYFQKNRGRIWFGGELFERTVDYKSF